MTIEQLSQHLLPEINTVINRDKVIIEFNGDWVINHIPQIQKKTQSIVNYQQMENVVWNLQGIGTLDSAGAYKIWQALGKKIPENFVIAPEHAGLFHRWEHLNIQIPQERVFNSDILFNFFRKKINNSTEQLFGGIVLLGQLVLDFLRLLVKPNEIPWTEVSITTYEAGVRALGITALVGFLIGIVLSYLSAIQLHAFGAEIYIIDILGMSIIRELGPLLAAILIAGRSGSAMTAQIGIMRVTEELDALSALGISHSMRLILPKVAALIVVLPLLTLWTDAAALFGGMLSANQTLDISAQLFFLRLPDSVPIANVFIGLGKSSVFGFMIALIACHFGFQIRPNTESLGNETTNSVVASITMVIMVDAVFAILFRNIGLP